MSGNGPPPNPNRRRRNAGPVTTKLPAEGRKGAPPAWPLGKPTKAAAALWAELWATPQAAAWERLGWTRIVARYVRVVLVAESSFAPVPLMAEVRQLEDRLGLTPMSMLRLRWEISHDELADRREPERAKRAPRKVKAFDAKLVAG